MDSFNDVCLKLVMAHALSTWCRGAGARSARQDAEIQLGIFKCLIQPEPAPEDHRILATVEVSAGGQFLACATLNLHNPTITLH